MPLQKLLLRLATLVIQMFPYRFSCHSGVHSSLGWASIKWRTIIIVVLTIGWLVILTRSVGRVLVLILFSWWKRLSIDFAIGLEILLLIKIHIIFYTLSILRFTIIESHQTLTLALNSIMSRSWLW